MSLCNLTRRLAIISCLELPNLRHLGRAQEEEQYPCREHLIILHFIISKFLILVSTLSKFTEHDKWKVPDRAAANHPPVHEQKIRQETKVAPEKHSDA